MDNNNRVIGDSIRR